VSRASTPDAKRLSRRLDDASNGALTFDVGDRCRSPSAWKSSWSTPRGQHHELDILAERVGAAVAGVQRECEAGQWSLDRRLQQIEREQQSLGQEKFSEVQGSVSGVLEEVQNLAKRLDSLDERVFTRTSAAESVARQGTHDLTQQVQALERHSRLASAAAEDCAKRLSNRQSRLEQALEDLSCRLAQTEEDQQALRQESCNITMLKAHLDARSQVSVRKEDTLSADMRLMESRLEGVEQHLSSMATCNRQDDGITQDLVTKFRAIEDEVSALGQKMSSQLEETRGGLASMRVKVDGQIQRNVGFAEQVEKALTPVLDSFRGELSLQHSKDFNTLEGKVAELAQRFDLHLQSVSERVEHLTLRVSRGDTDFGASRREHRAARNSKKLSSSSPKRG